MELFIFKICNTVSLNKFGMLLVKKKRPLDAMQVTSNVCPGLCGEEDSFAVCIAYPYSCGISSNDTELFSLHIVPQIFTFASSFLSLI